MSELHHIGASELEAYVMGALDAADITRVEAHVEGCARCQSRLEREARLELAFAALATRSEKRARDEERPRRALPAAAFGVLAMAAAMALWVTARSEDARSIPTGDDPAAAAAPPTVSADAATFTASLETQADGSRLGVRD